MTKVLLIDPRNEIILHTIQIINKESVKRFNNYEAQEVASRGYPLERILIREGFITVMEPRDEIPIPVERYGGNPK
jgi:hypothetical protein